MNFCVDFGAEDAGRLTPFKDDKPKDTENSPFEASSVLIVKAIYCKIQHSCKKHPYKVGDLQVTQPLFYF